MCNLVAAQCVVVNGAMKRNVCRTGDAYGRGVRGTAL